MSRRTLQLCWICLASIVLFTGCEKKSVDKESSARDTVQPSVNSDVRRVVQINADGCGLITPEDIQQVQGTTVRETKGGGSTDGRVQALQCYYVTAEPDRAVSVIVMKDDPAAPGQNGARQAWNRIFRRYGDDGEEHEEPGEVEEFEEEEHKVPVSKVDGIGEKAFWVGSHVGASLYVLKGNAYVRVSVSGADNDDIQLARSKTLAQKALDRL